jgi:hypothetical protein
MGDRRKEERGTYEEANFCLFGSWKDIFEALERVVCVISAIDCELKSLIVELKRRA